MSMTNWRAAQLGELHAEHAYAGSRDQEHVQDLPLLPLEITHVGCRVQAAVLLTRHWMWESRGTHIGVEECVWM